MKSISNLQYIALNIKMETCYRMSFPNLRLQLFKTPLTSHLTSLSRSQFFTATSIIPSSSFFNQFQKPCLSTYLKISSMITFIYELSQYWPPGRIWMHGKPLPIMPDRIIDTFCTPNHWYFLRTRFNLRIPLRPWKISNSKVTWNCSKIIIIFSCDLNFPSWFVWLKFKIPCFSVPYHS